MPFGQTFVPQDLFVVATLALLEGLLSADNALVLALLVRHLSAREQQRALSLGLMMAFVLRSIGILLAGVLIKLWWLCGIGALYLMFLAIKHFISKAHNDEDDEAAVAAGKKAMSFGKTVALVGFTDMVFAIDSILVAVALVNKQEKLWMVYAGGFLGLIALRLGASAFLRLLRHYPALDHTAYLLVAWAGVKLLFASAHLYGEGAYPHGQNPFHELPSWIFWLGFVLILLGGGWWAVKHKAETPEPADGLTEDCMEKMEKILEGEEDK